jgi:hypothetical protein
VRLSLQESDCTSTGGLVAALWAAAPDTNRSAGSPFAPVLVVHAGVIEFTCRRSDLSGYLRSHVWVRNRFRG